MAGNNQRFVVEFSGTELDGLRAAFEEVSGLLWSPFPQKELSLLDQLLGALRRLLPLHEDLHSQVRSLSDDKRLLERRLLRQKELIGDMNEEARNLEAQIQEKAESFENIRKELRAEKGRNKALEKDLKRLKNEQSAQFRKAAENTLEQSQEIYSPAPLIAPSSYKKHINTENRTFSADLQEVQTFLPEVHMAATRMSAKIDASYEVRRRYLLEVLRMDNLDLRCLELLKHTHVPEQGWSSSDNAKALLEKMGKYLQFQDLFDRFLSQRFKQFVGAEAEKVPGELGGHKWDKLISNDFRKIGDIVFLQCALQNFREIIFESIHLFQTKLLVEPQQTVVGGTNRKTPKKLSEEFSLYREKVSRLMDKINTAVAISQGHFEASGGNPPSSSSNNQ